MLESWKMQSTVVSPLQDTVVIAKADSKRRALSHKSARGCKVRCGPHLVPLAAVICLARPRPRSMSARMATSATVAAICDRSDHE